MSDGSQEESYLLNEFESPFAHQLALRVMETREATNAASVNGLDVVRACSDLFMLMNNVVTTLAQVEAQQNRRAFEK
ncbi:hypothetical protein D9V30_05165 [Mycetocola reblochoni]|uniref:Uncharacterized protein n=1 Tax=Mycetocola reblochoni TaxID=331618 RepID=A0A3L6ZQD0_9MICO|nr:hypothetical protein [Mycetocola reblochoni]RLP70057.1 hypothetical protein D9V30_05165 [Mycetocola reblochoni]